ncbi:MAG: isochorismatase family protein [Streptosporangiaceae bacterium]
MNTALLLVDVQRNMLEGDGAIPAAPLVRPALTALLERARAADAVIVHVQNDGSEGDPDLPFTPGWELVFPPAGGELVVRKDQPDTFASNPGLAGALRQHGVNQVVVAGMQSEYCIRATARAARAAGFDVVVAAGAHATYDNTVPAPEISAQIEQSLVSDGVEVRDAAQVTFR